MIRVELLTELLRHRHAVVLGAPATVTAAAWAYLLLGGGIEIGNDGQGRRAYDADAARVEYTLAISVIWWVMMVAMMPPTA